MARPGGLELPTFWFVARRSIQLSYGRTAMLILAQSFRWHAKSNSLSPRDQSPFFFSTWARRALTNFLMSVAGRGLFVGNWIVPLDVANPLSSFSNCSMTAAVGNTLQCFSNAANQISVPLYLNAGIP